MSNSSILTRAGKLKKHPLSIAFHDFKYKLQAAQTSCKEESINIAKQAHERLHTLASETYKELKGEGLTKEREAENTKALQEYEKEESTFHDQMEELLKSLNTPANNNLLLPNAPKSVSMSGRSQSSRASSKGTKSSVKSLKLKETERKYKHQEYKINEKDRSDQKEREERENALELEEAKRKLQREWEEKQVELNNLALKLKNQREDNEKKRERERMMEKAELSKLNDDIQILQDDASIPNTPGLPKTPSAFDKVTHWNDMNKQERAKGNDLVHLPEASTLNHEAPSFNPYKSTNLNPSFSTKTPVPHALFKPPTIEITTCPPTASGNSGFPSTPQVPSQPNQSNQFKPMMLPPSCSSAPTQALDPSIILASSAKLERARPKEDKRWKGDSYSLASFLSRFYIDVERLPGVDDREKYLELLKWTTGEAHNSIKQFENELDGTKALAYAKQKLVHHWGYRQHTAAERLRDIINKTTLSKGDLVGLRNLLWSLEEAKNTALMSGDYEGFSNIDLVNNLIDKRIPFLRDKWQYFHHKLTVYQKQKEQFDHFLYFLDDQVKQLESPYARPSLPPKKDVVKVAAANTSMTSQYSSGSNQKVTNKDSQGSANERQSSVNKYSNDQVKVLTCPLCTSKHYLSGCPTFLKWDQVQRFEYAKSNRLCFRCLNKHKISDCKITKLFCKTCNSKSHHTVLHRQTKDTQAADDSITKVKQTVPSTSTDSTSAQILATNDGGVELYRPLVAIHVNHKDKRETVYALLDTGSTRTCCSTELSERLNLPQQKVWLTVSTLDASKTELRSTVPLTLQSIDNHFKAELKSVVVAQSLSNGNVSFPTSDKLQNYPHLKDITLHETGGPFKIDVLIGMDLAHSLVPDASTMRRGPRNAPCAVQTRWGWTVFGGNSSACSQFECDAINFDNEILSQKLDKLFHHEFNDPPDEEKDCESINDKKALGVLKDSIKFVDGHYQVALPWKESRAKAAEVLDPDASAKMALKRLKKVETVLRNNEEVKNNVFDQVETWLREGYISIVKNPFDRPKGKPIWVMPIILVQRDDKPGKVRICHDAKAETGGVSLNSQLLSGPDLANNLVGCLMRFREHEIAIMADVKEFFYQVKVDPEDRDAFRFWFWPDREMKEDPILFHNNCLVFGAKPAPTAANFAVQEHATQNKDKFDVTTVNTIKRRMYVDDIITSKPNVSQGKQLIDQLTKLLRQGGFELGKFVSNSKELLAGMDPSMLAKSMQMFFDSEEIPTEKALGIFLDVTTDCFGFKISILKMGEKVTTRRKALSLTASIFDPLGFAAPFILIARQQVQKFCANKLGWDEIIPEEETKLIEKWRESLCHLEKVMIPRWLSSKDMKEIISRELHMFSDASMEGYGVAAYERLTDNEGNIKVSFFMGKARVIPLNQITTGLHGSIPRKELVAALSSAETAGFIVSQVDYSYDQTYFWVDSTCVLKQIRNENAHYKQFVANRLSKIHAKTKVEQWRYVPTKQNPADLCSRGIVADDQDAWNFYHNGPNYLLCNKNEWPTEDASAAQSYADSPDCLAAPIQVSKSIKELSILDDLTANISTWDKIIRRLAIFRRCIYPTKRKNYFSLSEYQNAELNVIKLLQKKHFHREYEFLSKNSKCCKVPSETQCNKHHWDEMSWNKNKKELCGFASPLQAFDPFLDENGIIRVGGRLHRADLTPESKHPAILPSNDKVVHSLIRYTHDSLAHGGTEQTLAELRQRFWIIKGRATVKKVLSSCIPCKKHHGRPLEQKMAPLPIVRTQIGYPFEATGVDTFGPFSIKSGRSNIKHWVLIFTCLRVRAVHLEVIMELSTAAFINALDRFRARRPGVHIMYSDNGTNFVGANKELLKAINEWNSDPQVHASMNRSNIEWHFNPPSSPHWGGVWERLVRTVKQALHFILDKREIKSDTFLTAVTVAEGIVNRRPLTRVPNEANDLEALTPIMILNPGVTALAASSDSSPPTTADARFRDAWKQSRQLADEFWRRWQREYISLLQSRMTWRKTRRNLKKGDLVLITNELVPRAQWSMAVVDDDFSDKYESSQLVRRVLVRTANGKTFLRDRSCLVLLEAAAFPDDGGSPDPSVINHDAIHPSIEVDEIELNIS